MMTETIVQVTSEEIDLVDFAIAWVRVLRKLKDSQVQGEIDSVAYFHIMQDIENMLHEVTKKILFIF